MQTLETIEQIELQLAELTRQKGEANARHLEAENAVDRLSREIGTRLIAGETVDDLQAQLVKARATLEATTAHVDAIPRHTKPLTEQLGPLKLQAAREKLEGFEAETVQALTAYTKALNKASEIGETLLGIRQSVESISRTHMNQLQARHSTFDVATLLSPVEELLALIETQYKTVTESAGTNTEKRKQRRTVQGLPRSMPTRY